MWSTGFLYSEIFIWSTSLQDNGVKIFFPFIIFCNLSETQVIFFMIDDKIMSDVENILFNKTVRKAEILI